MRGMLVGVVFVLGGCGFGGGGWVFGDFFVDAGGRFFFGGVDGHGYDGVFCNVCGYS